MIKITKVVTQRMLLTLCYHVARKQGPRCLASRSLFATIAGVTVPGCGEAANLAQMGNQIHFQMGF